MLAHQSKYSCAVQMDQTGCKEGWNHEALMHNIASKFALKSMKLPYGMLSGCIFHPHDELLWFLSTHLLSKCHRWLFFQGVPLTKVHVQTTCHTSVLRSSRLTKSPNQTWFQSKQHYCQCSKGHIDCPRDYNHQPTARQSSPLEMIVCDAHPHHHRAR